LLFLLLIEPVFFGERSLTIAMQPSVPAMRDYEPSVAVGLMSDPRDGGCNEIGGAHGWGSCPRA
jgi:hypothetical protein